jgi:hypothetical protein
MGEEDLPDAPAAAFETADGADLISRFAVFDRRFAHHACPGVMAEGTDHVSDRVGGTIEHDTVERFRHLSSPIVGGTRWRDPRSASSPLGYRVAGAPDIRFLRRNKCKRRRAMTADSATSRFLSLAHRWPPVQKKYILVALSNSAAARPPARQSFLLREKHDAF